MDILAVTHYPEMNIQTFFQPERAFLSLFVAWNKNPCSFLSEIDILAVSRYLEINI